MRPDNDLKNDVMEELNWDPKLNSSTISVDVKNGIVTLSGTVASYVIKLAAEEAVKRVKDVRGIAEEITVRLAHEHQRADAEIADIIRNAMQWHCCIPHHQVQAEVQNGWVTLEGQVDWQFQKDAAGTLVNDIVGIKGVTNIITVKPGNNMPVTKDNIKRALERSADIDAGRIIVETHGNKVMLRGKARSWRERTEVERVTWCAPGVADVEDGLIIAP